METVTFQDVRLLDKYLTKKGIDYVLTGTAALALHGALPTGYDIHDIDIIVLTTEEIRPTMQALFSELETLSGCRNDLEHYDQQVYVFKIGENGVKVNAFESNLERDRSVSYTTMCIDDTRIRVHDVKDILKAKFGLGRPKDHHFCVKMFNQLTAMFPCLKK